MLDNETPVLDAAAANAKKALKSLSNAGTKTLDSWVAYGTALSEGRALFDSDEAFGRWIRQNKLDVIAKHGDSVQRTNPHERAASLWAVTEPEAFEKMKAQHPTVQTVRGLHAKWKAHAKTVVASRALAEEEDTEKLAAELAAVADQTGIDLDMLAKETERQRAQMAAQEERRRKAEEEEQARIEALRAEIEAERELEENERPADPAAEAIAISLLLVLEAAVIDVLQSADAYNGNFDFTDPAHKSKGFHFAAAGLGNKKAEVKQVVEAVLADAKAGTLSEQTMEQLQTLATKGSLLQSPMGYVDPPAEFADRVGFDFATTVISALAR